MNIEHTIVKNAADSTMTPPPDQQSNKFLASFIRDGATHRERRRVSLLVVLSLIGIAVIGLYSAMWFFRGNITLAIIDLTGSILLAFNLISLKSNSTYKKNLYIGLFIFTVLLIMIFWNGSIMEATYLWFFVYPAIASFLLGSKRGGLVAIFLLIPILAAIARWYLSVGEYGYSPFFSVRFVLAYLVVTYLTYLFESTAEKNRSEIYALNQSLENTVKLRTQELTNKNELLAQEVAERTAAEQKIALSLREKEILLKEVYHRTKNNMNVIISLINLQQMHITPENIEEVFELLKHRIHSMSSVHERLYRSENVATLDLGKYILDIAAQLKGAFIQDEEDIEIVYEADHVEIGLTQAVPLGLAINEILTNAFKHGRIEGQKMLLGIELRHEGDHAILLKISDNGPGIPGSFSLDSGQTLGTQLIQILLIDQLSAQVQLETTGGTSYIIQLDLDE